MAKENPIYVIEFVDKRNTMSLLAEALAKEHIATKHSDLVSDFLIVSSGTEVQEIREAKRDKRKLAQIARRYQELGKRREVEYDLNLPAKVREAMEHIGGGQEKLLVRKIIKAEELGKYLPNERIDVPRQKTKIVIPGNPVTSEGRRKYNIGMVFPMFEDIVRTVRNIHKKTTYYKDFKHQIADLCKYAGTGEVKDFVFARPDVPYCMINSLREPTQAAVDKFIAGLKKD